VRLALEILGSCLGLGAKTSRIQGFSLSGRELTCFGRPTDRLALP